MNHDCATLAANLQRRYAEKYPAYTVQADEQPDGRWKAVAYRSGATVHETQRTLEWDGCMMLALCWISNRERWSNLETVAADGLPAVDDGW